MKLLTTGAWKASTEQLNELRALGHELIWHQQEAEPLPCPYEEVEGTVCNGLFQHHPIEKFTSLRYIQLTSAGYDRVPLEYIQNHKIEIHNARGVYSIPMAEHVIGCVLSIYRKLFNFKDFQRAGKWEKIRDLEELCGKRVLILGCGNIGTECAKRFKAFECKVTGLDISVRVDHPEYDELKHISNLKQLLTDMDIVVVTLPLTEETRNLLNAEALKQLPDGAILCNIARGGVIEQAALERELTSGRLSACLDVFEQEPLATDCPLWQLPNVMITPHNSFAGSNNLSRLYRQIIYNLICNG